MPKTIYESLVFLSSQLLTDIVVYLPKLLISMLVLVIGSALANTFRKVVIKLLETLRVSSAFSKTPVEHFLKDAEVGNKIEEIIGSVLYWLVMLVVIHTTVSILGLESLTIILGSVVSYLPTVVSAIIILFFGLLISGVVESLVKGAIKSVDGKSARLLGRISSYAVMTVTVLAAISELGIAKEFILILFIGFVVMLSLGFGLAIGLGGKELVSMALSDWYKKFKSDTKSK
ncbi:hypothetical protein KKD03_05040 [Patescibacteria group bacterium]|nr:hypothetical protein [Patescibacteria group bacterium]